MSVEPPRFHSGFGLVSRISREPSCYLCGKEATRFTYDIPVCEQCRDDLRTDQEPNEETTSPC